MHGMNYDDVKKKPSKNNFIPVLVHKGAALVAKKTATESTVRLWITKIPVKMVDRLLSLVPTWNNEKQ